MPYTKKMFCQDQHIQHELQIPAGIGIGPGIFRSIGGDDDYQHGNAGVISLEKMVVAE